jgi:tetratricopeptide (TPR) repeat protein
VCNALGDTLSAEKAFEGAYKADPKEVNGCYNLGVIYYRRKDFVNAVKYWEEGAARNPYFENISFMLGLTYQQYLNNPGKAIVHYENFYKANSGNKDVLHNLVMCYQATGNTAKANEYNAKLAKMPK